jgi:ribosome biogenesis protein ERB1
MLASEPHRRKLHFVPEKYGNLRTVPSYNNYIRERFVRCLDLYLCPRAKRMKVTVQPEDLIPKLPSPKDLQPFPTKQSMIFNGHSDLVRTVSIEPRGQYIVTGSDDRKIKIWEISTGRCIKTIETDGINRSVAWCTNEKISLIAVATDKRCLLINPNVGDIKLISKRTDAILSDAPLNEEIENSKIDSAVQWNSNVSASDYEKGIRIVLNHFQNVTQVVWHSKGDYFSTIMPNGLSRSVIIHQLSKRKSTTAFTKAYGMVQCVLFHPIKPLFFVATQTHIRVYDLSKQELIKKLIPSCKWISKIAIHPKGDNLLVSSYDKKIMWFDLDLSTKPYQSK